MLYNFNDFALMENVADAKKWLTENNIDLNNKEYIQIREMLRNKPAFTLMFTKFHFNDHVDIEELKQLYTTILESQDILNRLPKNILLYDNFEELTDNLRDININQSLKRFENELPLNFKSQFATLSPEKLDNLKSLTKDFFTLRKETRKLFTNKIKRYSNLEELVSALAKFIENSKGSFNFDVILDLLNSTSGVKVKFADEEKDIIVARFYSFEAMGKICSSTSWCIKDYQHQWENYVGGVDIYNTQYVIFNFNVPYYDNYFMIGVTIEKDGKIRAAHLKDDTDFKHEDDLYPYLKKIGVSKTVLAPMSAKEISNKEKTASYNS